MIEIKVSGIPRIEAVLSALTTKLAPRDLLDESSAVLLNHIRDRFLRGIDPDGTEWPVSKAAMSRAASGRGGGTLYDTGKLFHSIQLFQHGENERGIGTDVPYGIKHNLGLEGMPRRTFLGFSGEDVQTVQEIIERRVMEAMNAHSV